MPILTGLTLEEARAAAAKDHFTLHVANGQKSITVGNGIIIRSRLGGEGAQAGRRPSVVPSIGPPAVAVPSLTGMNCGQAAGAGDRPPQGRCVAGQYSDSVQRAGHLLVLRRGAEPRERGIRVDHPDVRQQLVEALRQTVAAGSYTASPQHIAQAMLEGESLTPGK